MKRGILPVVFWMLAWTGLASEAARSTERLLVILLDGIGFEEFDRVRSQGYFPYLGQPGKLVAPFPSLTNPSLVALTGGLGSDLSPGYEDYFFSRSKNRLQGGILDRLSPGFSKSSFRKVFDFHPPGYLSALEYLLPPWSCGWMLDLDSRLGLRKFRRSRGERFLLYLGASDCKSHMGGEGSTEGFLKKLGRRLGRLLGQYPETRLLLLSDHGNEASEYRRVRLAPALKRAGYRIDSRLREDRSVVFPRFGLIGAALLYTRTGKEQEVARVVAGQPGVHFAAVADGDAVHLFTGEGKPASIIREGERLRYDPGGGDPLEIGSAATLTFREWSDSTRDHVYPQAVPRVWTLSRHLVANPASVVVNLDRKRYSGSRWLDLFVSLRATHGGLSDGQSSGFIAASHIAVPAVAAVEEVAALIAP